MKATDEQGIGGDLPPHRRVGGRAGTSKRKPPNPLVARPKKKKPPKTVRYLHSYLQAHLCTVSLSPQEGWNTGPGEAEKALGLPSPRVFSVL